MEFMASQPNETLGPARLRWLHSSEIERHPFLSSIYVDSRNASKKRMRNSLPRALGTQVDSESKATQLISGPCRLLLFSSSQVTISREF